MILFSALSILVLIQAAIVVVLLYRLNSVEDIQKRELQKLVSEIAD